MMNRAYLVETAVQTESVEMDEIPKADSHCQPADIARTFSSSGSQSNESKILPRQATKRNGCHGIKRAWKLSIFIVILLVFAILLAAAGLSALFAVTTMRETVAIVAAWARTSSSPMIHATNPAMPDTVTPRYHVTFAAVRETTATTTARANTSSSPRIHATTPAMRNSNEHSSSRLEAAPEVRDLSEISRSSTRMTKPVSSGSQALQPHAPVIVHTPPASALNFTPSLLSMPHYVRIRLSDGGRPSRGRLEVLHNGTWGTVCHDEDWNNVSALVACKQLNYTGLIEADYMPDELISVDVSVPIWWEKVRCNGTEGNLGDCSNGGWAVHSCQHYNDVHVSCTEEENAVPSLGVSSSTESTKEQIVISTQSLQTDSIDYFHAPSATMPDEMRSNFSNSDRLIGPLTTTIDSVFTSGEISHNQAETAAVAALTSDEATPAAWLSPDEHGVSTQSVLAVGLGVSSLYASRKATVPLLLDAIHDKSTFSFLSPAREADVITVSTEPVSVLVDPAQFNNDQNGKGGGWTASTLEVEGALAEQLTSVDNLSSDGNSSRLTHRPSQESSATDNVHSVTMASISRFRSAAETTSNRLNQPESQYTTTAKAALLTSAQQTGNASITNGAVKYNFPHSTGSEMLQSNSTTDSEEKNVSANVSEVEAVEYSYVTPTTLIDDRHLNFSTTELPIEQPVTTISGPYMQSTIVHSQANVRAVTMPESDDVQLASSLSLPEDRVVSESVFNSGSDASLSRTNLTMALPLTRDSAGESSRLSSLAPTKDAISETASYVSFSGPESNDLLADRIRVASNRTMAATVAGMASTVESTFVNNSYHDATSVPLTHRPLTESYNSDDAIPGSTRTIWSTTEKLSTHTGHPALEISFASQHLTISAAEQSTIHPSTITEIQSDSPSTTIFAVSNQFPIISAPASEPAAPELRLVGGSDATRGRLEVLYKGLWGLVCNVGFDEADATVACRQLGHGSGTVLSQRSWIRWLDGVTVPETNLSTPIWMSAVSCKGSELYLYQCPHSVWNITSGCSLADDVVVKCQSLTTLRALIVVQPWLLRLSQLERKRGLLEIFHNGFWGAVCITGSNEDYDATAELACRNLNFSTGYSQRDDGQHVSLYALQDLLCRGNELSLAECNRSSTASDCHGEPLVVQCMDRLEDRMTGIRLLEGHDNSSGYVQLHVNGSWGFLCGSWGIHNAQVLCRQLGMIRSHPRLLSSRKRTLSSSAEVTFVADAFNCEGEEPTLWDCPRVLVPAYQSRCRSSSSNAVYLHCEA